MGRIIHGHFIGRKPSPEIQAWLGMIGRCYHQKHISYRNYGARGVRVCDRWLNSFPNFLLDVGPRPSPTHSLDRWPDNNGNYEPGNVRWATRTEQGRNKRNNRLVQAFGEALSMPEWAERYGLKKATLRRRIAIRGMDPERALTMPLMSSAERTRVMGTNRRITAFGETLCLADWAARHGMNRETLRHRIVNLRMDPEEALAMPVMSPAERMAEARQKRWSNRASASEAAQ